MKRALELTKRNTSVLLAWSIVVALFVVGTISSTDFAAGAHIRTILVTTSFIGLVGLGQTLCILTGGIDLSMPSVLAGTAVLTSYLAGGGAGSLPKTLLIVLGLSLVVGLINGLAIAYANVPPIIMTLGMNGALQGALLVYTAGGVAAQPPTGITNFVDGTFLGVSKVLLLWLVVTVVATLALGWSSFGRRLYAVGTNRTAARLAGIAVRRTIVVPYVVSAVCAAATGLLVLGFLGQAFVNMGDDYLFSSAIAVAIGGASILGGRGNYLGTVAGALVLTLIAAILPLFSLGTASLKICYGVILLAAVIIGRQRSRR